MLTVDESISEIRKFLKKLVTVINAYTTFSFLGCKVVDKSRVDDILCCIEASFPDEYKKLFKQQTVLLEKTYTSLLSYKQLRGSIQRKYLFSSDKYFVAYNDLLVLSDEFARMLEQDLRVLYRDL